MTLYTYRIRDMGVTCEEVTIGATPSASLPNLQAEGITEIHPGNYLFYGN
jgi:D-serine deaminase-like pyridoxal phosphate-dependent protein